MEGHRYERLESDVAAGLDDLEHSSPYRRRYRSRSYSRSRSLSRSRSRSRSRRFDDGGEDRRWPHDRGGDRRGRQPQPSCTVYIRNLPLDMDESGLSELLAAFPRITALRLGKDRINGRNKGYAFVDFASGDLKCVCEPPLNGMLMST